jgi:Family of unknown function (DUF5682)
MPTHIFGIRHHGPGSARHLVQALELKKPDIILLEGPPEAEGILSWAADADMQPPVAILAYVPDNPHNAVFYPFTHYSPEWQAILYGLQHNLPIRFMDMPLIHKLSLNEANQKANEGEDEDNAENEALTIDDDPVTEFTPEEIRRNPIYYLAEIAGYEDEEQWWEQHFELSQEDPLALFETVKDTMGALRDAYPDAERKSDLQREVFMRRNIQQAQNELYDTVAVICGAWHAPALEQKFTQKHEKELLKDLPKTKVECTWIPWTNDRLMFESGYGAGIISPVWYEHQWEHPEDDGTLWLTKTARVFRGERMDISSAHVIEAVRLVHSLTALRGLNRASLKEYTEATQTVMCMGSDVPLQLLKKDLVTGNRIGAIPALAPQSPLQLDFERQLKSLRLKITEGHQSVVLDLRKPLDLKKSIFFYRLLILGVNWATKTGVASKGTFKEQWELYWNPEMLIELIAKSAMGNTIELASNYYLKDIIASETELKAISNWLQLAIPAELTTATDALLVKMDNLAASASDIESLIASLFPLSEIMKYGNVRGTDQKKIQVIFTSIFYRTLVGLPMGSLGINEEQAVELAQQIKKLHKVVLVLDEHGFTTDWFNTLVTMGQNGQIAPFIAGTVHKLAYESQAVPPETTAQAFSQALSVGTDVAESAQWLEGFLDDAATILLLDEGVWSIIYGWVSELSEEHFIDLLPILRRTFSEYSSPEKDKIALKVKRGKPAEGAEAKQASQATAMVTERALPLIPTLEYLLGL